MLDLAHLVVPPALASGAVRCRHPEERELELLAGLFTDPHNTGAKRAYLALGFRIVGDYGLVLLAE